MAKRCSTKWNKPGIPHSDWKYVCIVDDLGERVGTCEMCDNSIRYVHRVVHSEFGLLDVGCHCAEKMTATSQAKESEQCFLKYPNERRRWTESGWDWSKDGKSVFKKERARNRVTICYPVGKRWKFVIKRGNTEQTTDETYQFMADSMAAAYDYIFGSQYKKLTGRELP